MSRTFSPPETPTGAPPDRAPGAAGDEPGVGRGGFDRATWVRVALTAGAVLVVLWPAWVSRSYRGVLAWLDPRLVGYLYIALAVTVCGAAVRTIVAPGRPLLPAGLRRWTGPAGLVGSMTAFCLPLFAAWHTGQWWGMVGGGVPYADPHIYFGGAERLLFFGDLDVYNSRRPLNAMFLAVRLAVTHLDLRMALVLGAMAAGAATWLAARAVARDLGPVAGFALFVGIFGFARVYGPTPMTEVLGVTLGALALAVIWNAVSTRNRWLAVGGILLLTVALDARSGVVLLPLLLPLWLAYHFRGSGRYDWRVLGACVAAVVVGLSMNYAAVAALGGDTDNVMGNGGLLVYGMAKGKASWNLLDPAWHVVFNDHPDTWTMSDPERNRFVNAEAREEVLAHPGTFVGAAVQSELNYLRMAEQEILLDVPTGWHGMLKATVALAVAGAFALRWRRDRVLAAAARPGPVRLDGGGRADPGQLRAEQHPAELGGAGADGDGPGGLHRVGHPAAGRLAARGAGPAGRRRHRRLPARAGSRHRAGVRGHRSVRGPAPRPGRSGVDQGAGADPRCRARRPTSRRGRHRAVGLERTSLEAGRRPPGGGGRPAGRAVRGRAGGDGRWSAVRRHRRGSAPTAARPSPSSAAWRCGSSPTAGGGRSTRCATAPSPPSSRRSCRCRASTSPGCPSRGP